MKTSEIAAIVDEGISLISKLTVDTWSATYMTDHRDRFIQIVKEVIRIAPKHANIADLGAAPFVITYALRELGYKVSAFDISPGRFNHLDKLNLHIEELDLDHPDSGTLPSNFDVIIFTEIFEHLRGNLILTMSSIKSMLSDQGKILLTTPNFRSVMGFYKFLIKGVSYSMSNDLFHEWNKINEIGHMGHVREYTLKELRTFFHKIGFEVKQSKSKPVLLKKEWRSKIVFWLEKITGFGSQAHFILAKSKF